VDKKLILRVMKMSKIDCGEDCRNLKPLTYTLFLRVCGLFLKKAVI
jgi:hypothetical protein